MKSASSSSFAASSPTGRPSSARPASEQAISADLLQDYLGSVLGSPAQPALTSPVRSTSAP